MPTASSRRRFWFTWLTVALLVALCGVLGFLQYRWIGEVSEAARDRMRTSLQSNLTRLGEDFNSELEAACNAMMAPDSPPDEPSVERAVVQRFRDAGNRHSPLLHQVAVARPDAATLDLRVLNWQSGAFEDAEWPAAWDNARRRFESIVSRPPGPGPGFGPDGGRGPGGPPPPPPGLGPGDLFDPYTFETPVFGDAGPGRFGEIAWMIFQLDAQYVREVFLPELVRRNLNSGAETDYEVTVVSRPPDSLVIYESQPGQSQAIRGSADASAPLFGAPPPRGRGPEPPPAGRGPGPRQSRWETIVRHRAGSLEAAVARTRRANLAVTGCVLLMMLLAVGALVRFTRRAQHLAHLQMDFVAGVSHELRTPLTVIHTAAYNLQGRLSNDQKQVERYGSLIQKESARLKELVEQILRFARSEAGHPIESLQPVSIASVIDSALQNNRESIEDSGCMVEHRIAPDLPKIQGDAGALEQMVSNLLSNAIKYGSAPGAVCRVAISADLSGPNAIELRVADRGPGIPSGEIDQVFDPFFRGAAPRDAQIHGTGLGLTLVKKIVDAHSGKIAIHTQPMQGTEFVVRLPIGPPAPNGGGARG